MSDPIPKLITNLDDVRRVVARVYATPNRTYSYDFETLGLRVMRLKVAGIGIGWGPGPEDGAYILTAHEDHPHLDWDDVLEVLKPMLEDDTLTQIAHKSLFDASVLDRFGVKLHTNTYDTMVMSWLLNTESPNGLKGLVKRLYDHDMVELKEFVKEEVVSWHPGKILRLDKAPIDKLNDYAVEDVVWTYRLWQDALEVIREDADLDRIYHELYQEYLLILAQMQVDGIALDVPFLRARETNTREELTSLMLSIITARPGQDFDGALCAEWTAADVDRERKNIPDLQKKWSDRGNLRPLLYEHPTLAHKIFNPGSGLQLNQVLFDELGLEPLGERSASGLYSVGAEYMAKYVNRDPSGFVRQLMRYTMLQKLQGTYHEGLQELVDDDGRIRTSFNATLATGRLSSSSPNVQNIPSRTDEGKEIRRAFVARSDEWTLVAADFSQMEMRIAAHLSGDVGLIEGFFAGADPHSITAKLVFDLPCEFTEVPDQFPKQRAIAKAQPVDEIVLTPTGWRAIGDIGIGDQVIGSSGQPIDVLGVYPQGERDAYRVTFSDGSSVECDLDHLWTVHTRSGEKTLPLRELVDSGLSYKRANGNRESKYWLPSLAPIQHPHRDDLLLDPYVLGALLGDGTFSQHYVGFSSVDDEIVDAVSAGLPEGASLKKKTGTNCDYYVHGGNGLGRGIHNPVVKALKDLGLMGCRSETKFIPERYLLAPVEDRVALLQGLLDTDGSANTLGSVVFGTASSRLVDDFLALVRSLGGTGKVKVSETTHLDCYRVVPRFPKGFQPFRLTRKAERHAATNTKRTKYNLSRFITSVEPSRRVESVCILVDATDSLYVTRDYLLTHNTLNFGVLYGAGAERVADTIAQATKGEIVPSIEEAQGYKDDLLRKMPGVRDWIAYQERLVKREGKVFTLIGRPRHLVAAQNYSNDNRREFFGALRKAVNTSIQGTAADIIALAKRNLRREFLERGWWRRDVFLVLQVHDELLFEVRKPLAEDVADRVRHHMEHAISLDVPVVAEPSIADTWLDAKG